MGCEPIVTSALFVAAPGERNDLHVKYADAAAAFDGDVGHNGLSTPQLAFQLFEVAAIAAVWVLAIRRLINRRPQPASA
jgi:hypothetical protein